MAEARYATVAELKVRIQKTDDSEDTQLFALLEAAAVKIDRFCNRIDDGFLASETASVKHYQGSGKVWQLIDECVAITLVEVKDSPSDVGYVAWTTPTTPLAGDGDWYAFSGDPEQPDFNGLPYTALMIDPNGDESIFVSGRTSEATIWRSGVRGRNAIRHVPTVRVTAHWGFSASVPLDIREATIMQAARWYKRLQGSMADALASTDLGQLLYTEQLDPDIAGILLDGRYKRPVTGYR